MVGTIVGKHSGRWAGGDVSLFDLDLGWASCCGDRGGDTHGHSSKRARRERSVRIALPTLCSVLRSGFHAICCRNSLSIFLHACQLWFVHGSSPMMSSPAACGLSRKDLEDELLNAAREGHDFAGTFCPRIRTPSALEFMRDYVLPNRPCVITDAIEGWPATSRWTDQYLDERLGETPVSVNVTPNGRGDAVLDDQYFVMPEERRMTFHGFLSALRNSRRDQGEGDDVFYLSHQNDNLRTQLACLFGDVAPSIPFAEEAFGTKPDAVNLWMGDAR